ncbi:tail fiber domain-containing protein [Streptomyces avermitilis]|uniref:tail fiber domain-containing protein n=1 Tax=Streptomyces avermitilis TaxID=33903 RepID=UPI0033AE1658
MRPWCVTDITAPVGPVNGYAVLETVAALPISTWRYLWEPEGVRHLGPMAQDWHAAFGFNQDDTTISPSSTASASHGCAYRHCTAAWKSSRLKWIVCEKPQA